MNKRQAKRARFYKQQKSRRMIDGIRRANRNKPGFLGVATSFSIDGKKMGMGTLFLGGSES